MSHLAEKISAPLLPPQALRPWLDATGSITQMAKQCCESVRVKLLHTAWDEASSYHREILMLCDETPWWYAHTHLPQETFQQRASLFQGLGDNSLGCVLFSDPNISRQSLQYFEVGCDDPAYQKAARFITIECERLWARESVYHIEGLPLYLLEVFLPDMLKIAC